MFTNILCPTDFSENAARALTHAAAIAQWCDARLTVLHVSTTLDDVSRTPADAFHETAPTSGSPAAILANIERTVAESGAAALNVRALVQEGRPTEVIVNCAVAMGIDLLVMGTHGLSGFRRLLLGSVAEKVVRTAPCPVLTVPPHAAPMNRSHRGFERVLCAVDFSPSSLAALRYGLNLARDGRAAALHVLEDPAWDEDGESGTAGTAEQHALTEAVRQHLREAVAAEQTITGDVSILVVTARTAREGILKHASAAGVSLIAMGAQGAEGVELMLYGSSTQHVVRGAACPVLTVRA